MDYFNIHDNLRVENSADSTIPKHKHVLLLFANVSNPGGTHRVIFDRLQSIYKKVNSVNSWENSVPFEIVYVPCDRSFKLYENAVRTMPWPYIYFKDKVVEVLKSYFLLGTETNDVNLGNICRNDDKAALTPSNEPHIFLISPDSGKGGGRVISSHIADVLLQRTWYTKTPRCFDYYNFASLLRDTRNYNMRLKIIAGYSPEIIRETPDVAPEVCEENGDKCNVNCDDSTAGSTDQSYERYYQHDPSYKRTGNTMRRCSMTHHCYPAVKYKGCKCLRGALTPVPIDVSDHDANSMFRGAVFGSFYLSDRTIRSLPDSMVFSRNTVYGRRYYPVKSKRKNKGKNSKLY